VVDADCAVVHVFKLGLFGDDGLGETGFASATGSDETDLATEYDFHRLLEVVNVHLRAVNTTLDDFEGNVCERKIFGKLLLP
jgi:hypothetical protein